MYTQAKGYGFTPALQRTRKPFQARNILTLGALLTFVGGVCKYSIEIVHGFPSITQPLIPHFYPRFVLHACRQAR